MRIACRCLWISVLLVTAALLGGCASSRLISANVQSFHTGPAPMAQSSYRFERLPSQANQPTQSQWEAVVEQVLSSHGLQRSDASPLYTVQVSTQVLQYADPSDMVWNGGFVHHRGMPFYGGFPEPTRYWYRYSARVLIRDLAGGNVIYESTGSFDGPWNDSAKLVPVILQATLRDYPNASDGVRQINVELPPDAQPPSE